MPTHERLGAGGTHWNDYSAGAKWAINDRRSVGADHELYTYNPNENVENGGYVAHVIWFDITQKF